MKTMNALLCGLGLFLTPALHAQDDWTQKSTAPSPSARESHAMASLGGDQVLLFGGATSGGASNGETWVYDLSDNTWTQKFPASSPSVRFAHAMAYLGGDQMLLFGGATGPSNGETWVYDLSANTWTQKFPASSPSARTNHAMAYLGDDQVLLFGGFTSSLNGETWVYDLSANTWTQKFPASSPSARHVHAMASLGGDQVLLFGGTTGTLNNETWVYDLSDNTWTQKFPASSPSARFYHAMASLGGDQVLLFGGSTGTFNGETWVYDLSDNTWTQKFPASSPSARATHAMADIGSDHVLLFGGDTGTRNDETWVYTATPSGCSNIALNRPTLASSTNGSNASSRAVDGNANTFWRSASGGTQYLRVNLGTGNSYSQVTINWRAARYARSFTIRVSNNANFNTSTTVFSTTTGTGGTQTINLSGAPRTERFILLHMTVVNSNYYAVNEFEVCSATASFTAKESEVAKSEVITDYVLEQNYPNPFNPTTQISFAIPEARHVSLKIFNLAGQEVATLVNETRERGNYTVTFDASRLTSGVYFSVLQAGEVRQVRRLVLMK